MNDQLKKFYSQYSPTQKVELPSSSKQKVKEAIFANLHKAKPENVPSPWKIHLNSFWLKSYTVVPLALLLMIAGSAFASADSLPGDVFYPVKRTVENLRIITAPTEENKQSLEVEFANKRLLELEKLQEAQAKKSKTVKIENQDSKNEQEVSTPEKTEKAEIENSVVESPEQEADTKPEKTTQKVSSFAKKFIKLKKSTQDTQEKASQDAQRATEFLETTQRKLESEKRSEQAKQIQEKLKEFRKRQAERNRDNDKSDESEGEQKVRGDFRQSESNRDNSGEGKNEQENER